MDIKTTSEKEKGERVYLTPDGIVLEPRKELEIDFIIFKTINNEQSSEFTTTIFYIGGRSFQIRWQQTDQRDSKNP